MKLVTWQEAASRLSEGEAGVIPTDTLYGIVGSALKPATVERVYDLRRRERDKPMIVLIGAWSDLDRFQIELPVRAQNLFKRVWPGAVSVIVPVLSSEWRYLHRGTQSVAFRMPAKPELHDLLVSAGPLVAPSANLAGQAPALTVHEAEAYFGDAAFYLDGGRLDNPPSALVDARADPPRILRPVPGFELQ